MEIIIIIGVVMLVLSGIFLGRVLAVNPEQRKTEDKEQMEWIKRYQETKGMR